MGEILAAFLKTGSGTFFNLLFGMLTNKLFAVSLGPEGIGLFSLLRQTRDLFVTISTLNGSAAFVQGLSSRKDIERENYHAVVFVIILTNTLLVTLILFLFAPQISQLVFHQSTSQAIVLTRGLCLPVLLGSSVFYFGGVLNGHRAIGRFVALQISIAGVTTLLAYPVARWVSSGFWGAFVVLMTVSTLSGTILGWVFIRREKWTPTLQAIRGNISNGNLIQLGYLFLGFALTSMITGFANSGTVLAVRSMITAKLGLNQAGIFDVGWTLNMVYITLALTGFTAYYLPTLSQCNNDSDSSLLINRVLRLTMIVYVPLLTSIVIFKTPIINLLYSKQFLSGLDMIRWMFLGVFLKSIGWVFGVTILTRADKKNLFWSETLWMVGFLILSAFSINRLSTIEWIGLGFTINYAIYLLYTYVYARKWYHFILERGNLLKLMIGLLILFGVSVSTWNTMHISWIKTAVWLLIATLYAFMSMNSQERYKFLQLITQKSRLLII
jgi:O-antigen/teichoic acid export membrane protein